MMLRKPGDPSYKSSKSSSKSRKAGGGGGANDKPDDIVRKLQRSSGGNKKCADCSAKMPQAANLTHGTFVCLACAGIQ